MQDPVTLGLWLCPGQVAVQGDEPQRDSKAAAIMATGSHAEFIAKSCEGTGRSRSRSRCGYSPQPSHVPGAQRRYSQLGPPAAQPGGHVRYPQGVAPAVLGLEQAQLPAGCGRSRRAKTRIGAGQPSGWSPSGPSRSSPVSSVGPVPRMPAGPVRAGTSGPALAHLAALIDGDLPGLPRDEPDRGALAGAHLPADGLGQ